MISVLLPCYKSVGLLQSVFLPGILRNTYCDLELIIYDNGGNGNFNYLKDVEFCKVIGNGNNVGLNKALNECSRVAHGDYFYLPHTDMYIMPNCLESLLLEAKKHAPHTFLFCSRSIEPTKGHTNFHIIANYGQECNSFDREKLLKDFKDYRCNDIFCGARMPFFLHRKLWDKMLGVDENYFSYCTDDDLIQEAYGAGVRKFWMIYNSTVYHLQGKSNNQQKVDKDCNKPYEYFVQKWRKRGYGDASHPSIWQSKMIPFESKIR